MSKLKQNESVAHIMTKDLQTVNVQTPLSTVGKIFAESRFHHLPVVRGEKLIGIITFVDLMRVNFEDSFGVEAKQSVYEVLDRTLNVEAVMTWDPVTLRSNETIKQAAKLLASRDFNALPVVGEDMELLGLVTSADLIDFLIAQY